MTLESTQTDRPHHWEHFKASEVSRFLEWIAPRTLDDFRGQRVLDAGCASAHALRLVAEVAEHIDGVGTRTAELAAGGPNIALIEADFAQYTAPEAYDVVYSLGALNHADNPDKAFANLHRLTKSGGLTIIGVWSAEGNGLLMNYIEPLRAAFLRDRTPEQVEKIADFLTASLYPIAQTAYRLPLLALPYADEFQTIRQQSLRRSARQMLDRLNAPYTEFILRDRVERWFNPRDYEEVTISFHKGISWAVSGRKRASD